ncbi:hypothetical protein ABT319_24960, partial [Streptomyces sp. NPDC000678]
MTRPAGPVVAGTAGGRLGTVAGPGTGRLVPPRPEAPARAVAGPAAVGEGPVERVARVLHG